MSSNKPDLTWLQILEAIKVRADGDIRSKVVPAVNTTRSTLGTLLIILGNKLQPK